MEGKKEEQKEKRKNKPHDKLTQKIVNERFYDWEQYLKENPQITNEEREEKYTAFVEECEIYAKSLYYKNSSEKKVEKIVEKRPSIKVNEKSSKVDRLSNWENIYNCWKKILMLKQIEVSVIIVFASLLAICGAALTSEKPVLLKTSRKLEDLRFHVMWFLDSRGGKGELVSLIASILEKILSIAIPGEISDAVQTGGVKKNGTKVQGIYIENDIVIHDECENLFQKKDWMQNIFVNMRKNMDTYKSSSNWLENTKINTAGENLGGYGKATLFMASYPIKKQINRILTTGTLQRPMVISEKVGKHKSRKIFNAMKEHEHKDEELEKEIKNFVNCILRLKEQNGQICLAKESYNKVVDEYDQFIQEKYENFHEEQARLYRSFAVGQLLLVQKAAAIITAISGNSVVEKEALTIASKFIKENFEVLITESDFIDYLDKNLGEYIQDIRDALSRENKIEFTKTEINSLMAKYWGLKDNKTIIKRLGKAKGFVLRFVRKEGNTQYWALK